MFLGFTFLHLYL